MKNLAILLLSTFSLHASAQSRTTASKSETKVIVKDNDGKNLYLTVKSNKGEKEINYDHIFNVQGMGKQQKDALIKRITDSLGVSQPPPPPAPHSVTTALVSPKTNTSASAVKLIIKDDDKTLHLILSSNQAGKEVNYDHTYAVAGMSKQQKDALVKRVTDSLQVK